MEENIVVGLGEALWDVLPDGRKMGGAPANFAYHAGQFGMQSVAVSALGNDSLADETCAVLDSKNLRHIMPRVDYPTGTVQVTLGDAGIPSYDIKEGAAWDNIPLTEEMLTVARNARAVCFGSLAQRSEVSRNTIRRFVAATPSNCMRIFDINMRQHFYTPEIIAESLRMANVLKINDEELDILGAMYGFDSLEPDDRCWLLMGKYNLDMVVLTCGAVGSYVFARGEMSYQATPHVTVADTVGAGDSFTGSFCAAIINGMPVAEAHRLAVDVSAYVCTQNGAMPTMPSELKARVKASK